MPKIQERIYKVNVPRQTSLINTGQFQNFDKSEMGFLVYFTVNVTISFDFWLYKLDRNIDFPPGTCRGRTMDNLKALARRCKVSDEKVVAILDLPKWWLENGLKNYEFNESMVEYFEKEIRFHSPIQKIGRKLKRKLRSLFRPAPS
jgi:hypothetical protein